MKFELAEENVQKVTVQGKLKNWYVLEALSFALSFYLLVFDSITLFIRAI